MRLVQLIVLALVTSGCVAVLGQQEPCPCAQMTMVPSCPATAASADLEE